MKKITLVLLLTLCIALWLPMPVSAHPLMDDQVTVGGTVRVESGETIEGSLILIGGQAIVSDGARITGDLVILGGQADISGQVDGDVLLIGAHATLQSTAIVNGDVQSFSSILTQDAGAKIAGEINDLGNPKSIKPPAHTQSSQPLKPLGDLKLNFSPIAQVTGSAFQGFFQAIFAMLVALVFPRPLSRVAKVIHTDLLRTTAIGLLCALLAPGLILLTAITLIGIPVAVFLILVLVMASVFGYFAIGTEIGNRIAATFKAPWHIAVRSGVGTMLLALVSALLGRLGPGGIILIILISLLGLGSVVRSRFGSRD